MRTRLTLRRSVGRPADIVVTTDVGATVRDVAEAVARAEAAAGRRTPNPGEVLTLAALPPDGARPRSLPRELGLAEAGLRAGSTVALVPASDRFAEPGAELRHAYARLRVAAGPQAGLELDLPRGVSSIGRGQGCDVRLADPMVSKLHARIIVEDTIEIVDAGSSNGVVIGGGRVARAAIGPDDQVLLGDTVVTVTRLVAATGTGDSGATVAFNRSPRVVPVHPESTVQAPTPPDPAKPGRFPILAMVAPLLMGVVLFSFTRSPMSLVFVALSPLLMAGTYVDKRFTDRKRLEQQTAEFGAALTALEDELTQGQEAERRTRLGELASTAEAVASAATLDPLLWSRRPEHDTFLTLRLGIGAAPSRTTVELPPRGQATAEHWGMLEDLRTRFADVAGVPVAVDLRDCGALGVAGPPEAADDVARGVLAQLVCLHSPAELVITGIASVRSRDRWDWLKWLPHVASPHSPLHGAHLAADPATAMGIVTALEELAAARQARKSRTAPLPAVVLVAEDDAQADRGRLVRLAEEGPAAGVHVLWCATRTEDLPAACRAFVALGPDGAQVGLTREGSWRPLACEGVGAEEASLLGRRLAAVVDAGAPVIDESDLPRSVSYLALAGSDLATDPMGVLERWRETGSIIDRASPPVRRRTDPSLRALVGQGATGQFLLDLRSQGPHALVGGTTGSGKSEFLQAWVLGMAAAHSPDRISFLFVDYKGGAAFADCVDLPHTVGLVTDLSPHLVRRALTSLRAELRHREHLLGRKKAKDLLALERAGDPEAPPALVIVVDEFAALVSEVPEFVDGMVDVAQRGRSLGLHLVLATQRPAGVIKENLRANTNLRIALRMADEHDSADVLGSPVAATFDPSAPGRGAVRTGPGRIAMFQTGYAGGRSTEVRPPAAIGLESLEFGPGEPWDVPPEPGHDATIPEEGPSDIARSVRTIKAAASVQGIPAPRKPWLPELASVYDVAALGPHEDGRLVLGLLDRPSHQEQGVLHWTPDADGCLVVHGTSGSGKSGALRALAVSVALGVAAGGPPVQVYGLDFGAGGLAMLAPLPVVGAVVDGSDAERVGRLLRRLRDAVDERAGRFAAARAGTIAEYRQLTGRHDEPRILLVVDGLSAFRDSYELEMGRAKDWAAFQRVVAEGRPLGVHVVISAERPGAVPTSLAGYVQRRLILRQADENAYGVLGVPKDVLAPTSPPGRGVLAGGTDEIQVAVPGGATSPAEQAALIEELAEHLRASGVPAAPPVQRLPEVVAQSSMPATVDGLPVLGVADDTLAPCGFEPHGSFLLAGLPGSGRTTVLASLATSLRRAMPTARLLYVGNRRSPVHTLGVWTQVAVTPDDAAALARSIVPDLAEPPGPAGPIMLLVEGIAEFLGGPAEQALAEAVKTARRNDHFVLAESETSTWGSSWPLVAEVRGGRRGLVLQPDHLDGDGLFRTAFPRMSRAEFPPGRGMYVEAGRLRRVQVPLPD